jgi:fibronectin type 3 domain-containing protein
MFYTLCLANILPLSMHSINIYILVSRHRIFVLISFLESVREIKESRKLVGKELVNIVLHFLIDPTLDNYLSENQTSNALLSEVFPSR